MSWILVFWLTYPNNYAEYQTYRREKDCRAEQRLWQRRFDLVKSQLQADCRELAP